VSSVDTVADMLSSVALASTSAAAARSDEVRSFVLSASNTFIVLATNIHKLTTLWQLVE
jgi:hypothetical protein